MRDLTAILMGDPAAAHRRAPTERERLEWKMPDRLREASQSFIIATPIGSERLYPTWQKARNAQKMLNAKGLKASMRRNDDGTYTVRRVG